MTELTSNHAADAADLGLSVRMKIQIALTLTSIILLVIMVLKVEDAASGLTVSAIIFASLVGSLATGSVTLARLAMPHVLSIIPLTLSALGACSQSCGGFGLYESILGVDLAIWGLLAHVGAITCILIHGRYPSRFPHWLLDIPIGCCVGASIFYSILLASLGGWCSACVGVHVLMCVQLVVLVKNGSGGDVVRRVAVMLAMAGTTNAVYHHRLVPQSVNEPAELLAYLQGAWGTGEPKRATLQVRGSVDSAANGTAPASLPTPAQVSTVELGLEQATAVDPNVKVDQWIAVSESAYRNYPTLWGSPDAPIIALANIDLNCDACALQMTHLMRLERFVNDGRLAVRFLFTYRDDSPKGRDFATIAIAGGFLGQDLLMQLASGALKYRNELDNGAALLNGLDQRLKSKLGAVVQAKFDAITSELTAADRFTRQEGTGGRTPNIWLSSSTDESQTRSFEGVATADKLILAIDSLP